MTSLPFNADRFPVDFNWHNDQFPPLDAIAYWHYLQGCNAVIEVGCGYSTYLAMKSGKSVLAIDPNPRIEYPQISYLKKIVQEVPVEVFLKLKQGDILFIDSSHIYSEGSDVFYLINEVLPNLNKGVLIHFHDYFGEHGYPDEWKKDPNMREWNENEHIQAIKNRYEVLSENFSYSKQNNDFLKQAYSFVPDSITENLGAVRGASLWLKN